MSNSSSDDSLKAAALVASIGLPLLIIFVWAKKLGVDFEVLLSAIGYSILWVAIYVGWLWYGENFLNDYSTTLAKRALFWLPLLAVFVWPCWWETLTQISAHGIPRFAYDPSEFSAWYSASWFLWLVELAFVGAFGWQIKSRYAY